MANQWLRLWHDMPNDPKWRTIARVSGQPITSVISVYIHLLVIASNASERGRTHDANTEDIASALDLDAEQVQQICSAMQGRVLDGDLITGWEKRQVAREDGSAERAKAWREQKKNAAQQQANASERKGTPDTDKDTDKEKKNPTAQPAGFAEFWLAFPRKKNKGDAERAWKAIKPDADLAATILSAIASAKQSSEWRRDGGQFIPYPASWLRAKGWEDVIEVRSYSADAMALMADYNAAMVPRGWPEAVADPYSAKRAAAISEFLGLRSKDGWISAYLDWMATNVPPRDGFGFDWLILPQTVVRAREGNFAGVTA